MREVKVRLRRIKKEMGGYDIWRKIRDEPWELKKDGKEVLIRIKNNPNRAQEIINRHLLEQNRDDFRNSFLDSRSCYGEFCLSSKIVFKESS